ncbi:hypothetical protein [Actinokineospora sp.]|uniref:hypothetical protein n=1 Tax=Actinokineospora sp. TaxID=1872133 RepID=UPI004037ABAA
MPHTVFIAIHAAAGGLAFVAGCVAISRRALFGTYLWSLVTMAVFLVLAVAAEWTVIGTGARVLFAAFAVLALVMVWRADQARRIRHELSAAYVGHVGFTLVALFDAFMVILVLRAGAPGWLIAAVGVVIAVVGHFVLVATRERLVVPGVPRVGLGQ